MTRRSSRRPTRYAACPWLSLVVRRRDGRVGWRFRFPKTETASSRLRVEPRARRVQTGASCGALFRRRLHARGWCHWRRFSKMSGIEREWHFARRTPGSGMSRCLESWSLPRTSGFDEARPERVCTSLGEGVERCQTRRPERKTWNAQNVQGRTRIHIWAPVQNELERRALRELERLLVANGRRCVVFAGLPIGSHETDLAVVVESLVLTIEAESGTGAWRIMGPPLTRLRQDVQDRNGA